MFTGRRRWEASHHRKNNVRKFCWCIWRFQTGRWHNAVLRNRNIPRFRRKGKWRDNVVAHRRGAAKNSLVGKRLCRPKANPHDHHVCAASPAARSATRCMQLLAGYSFRRRSSVSQWFPPKGRVRMEHGSCDWIDSHWKTWDMTCELNSCYHCCCLMFVDFEFVSDNTVALIVNELMCALSSLASSCMYVFFVLVSWMTNVTNDDNVIQNRESCWR